MSAWDGRGDVFSPFLFYYFREKGAWGVWFSFFILSSGEEKKKGGGGVRALMGH